MAVSGGCTASSYTYTLRGGVLRIKAGGARLRAECDTVAEAVAKLGRGEPATVAGGDAFPLRNALAGMVERVEVGA